MVRAARAADTAAANEASLRGTPFNAPYPDLDHGNNFSRNISRSPWLALMNAGFGMMAGSSPYAGINIGKGLLAGTETLTKQREADKGEEEVNQRARQLALTAQQHFFWRQNTNDAIYNPGGAVVRASSGSICDSE
jgi:hypothetical protein